MKTTKQVNIPLFVVSFLAFAVMIFIVLWREVGFEFTVIATPIIVLLFGIVILLVALTIRKKPTPEEENRSWKMWMKIQIAFHTLPGLFVIGLGIYNLSKYIKIGTEETATLTLICFGGGLLLILIGIPTAILEVKFMRWFAKQVQK